MIYQLVNDQQVVNKYERSDNKYLESSKSMINIMINQ